MAAPASSGAPPADFPFPSLRDHAHRTGAGTFASAPALVLFPRSESQIVSTVRLARTSRRRIAIAGAGRSPSDMTCTSSWLISLDNVADIVSVAPETGIVVAQAGIRLGQLAARLEDEWGLTLASLPAEPGATLAGALATATHAVGPKHGPLSDWVVALRLVLANGDAVTCRCPHDGGEGEGQAGGDGGENDDELCRAALASLGAVAIITEVTLRAVPAFRIRWSRTIMSDAAMLASWEDGSLWARSEFVRVTWMPHARRAVVWSADRSDEAERGTRRGAQHWRWLGGWLGPRICRALMLLGHRLFPRMLPWVERLACGLQFGFRDGTTATGVQRSSRALPLGAGLLGATAAGPRDITEWAVPLERGPEALRRIAGFLDPLAPLAASPSSPSSLPSPTPIPFPGGANLPVLSPIVFSAIGDAAARAAGAGAGRRPLLDPACHDGATLWIGATLHRPLHKRDPPGAARWREAFEWLMRDLGGRPHWASTSLAGGGGGVAAAELATMYGGADDEMTRWKAVRDRVDPDGVFVGPWLRRNVLGAGGPTLDCEEVEVGREPMRGDGWRILGQVGVRE